MAACNTAKALPEQCSVFGASRAVPYHARVQQGPAFKYDSTVSLSL